MRVSELLHIYRDESKSEPYFQVAANEKKAFASAQTYNILLFSAKGKQVDLLLFSTGKIYFCPFLCF